MNCAEESETTFVRFAIKISKIVHIETLNFSMNMLWKPGTNIFNETGINGNNGKYFGQFKIQFDFQ